MPRSWRALAARVGTVASRGAVMAVVVVVRTSVTSGGKRVIGDDTTSSALPSAPDAGHASASANQVRVRTWSPTTDSGQWVRGPLARCPDRPRRFPAPLTAGLPGATYMVIPGRDDA